MEPRTSGRKRKLTQLPVKGRDKEPGVIGHGDHAVFIVNGYMYNVNDCDRGIPQDGFHTEKWIKYDSKRPLMQRKHSLHDPVHTDGLCLRTSNLLSKIYYKVCDGDYVAFNEIVLDPWANADNLFNKYHRNA